MGSLFPEYLKQSLLFHDLVCSNKSFSPPPFFLMVAEYSFLEGFLWHHFYLCNSEKYPLLFQLIKFILNLLQITAGGIATLQILIKHK